MTVTSNRQGQSLTRRGLLSGAGAVALSFAIVRPEAVAGTQANSRIKAGVIGLGSRGRMIAGMVQKHGDSHDVFALTYEFPNGMILNHRGEHLKNRSEFRSDCIAQGRDGWLETGYTSRVRILGNRTGWRGGDVVNLYPSGAERNIDTFHKCITTGRYDNPTLEPSVNATLTTILGREAARRRTKLTLDEVLKENRHLEPDLTGLRE